MFDESAPWGLHSYEKAVYLDELSDGAIEVILEHQPTKMSPLSFVPIFVLGGAYRRADGNSTAFGGSRSIRYVVKYPATTPIPADSTERTSLGTSTGPPSSSIAVGVGGYVNFMTDYDEDRPATHTALPSTTACRIKATYDPNNIFHLNANIVPAS